MRKKYIAAILVILALMITGCENNNKHLPLSYDNVCEVWGGVSKMDIYFMQHECNEHEEETGIHCRIVVRDSYIGESDDEIDIYGYYMDLAILNTTYKNQFMIQHENITENMFWADCPESGGCIYPEGWNRTQYVLYQETQECTGYVQIQKVLS